MGDFLHCAVDQGPVATELWYECLQIDICQTSHEVLGYWMEEEAAT